MVDGLDAGDLGAQGGRPWNPVDTCKHTSNKWTLETKYGPSATYKTAHLGWEANKLPDALKELARKDPDGAEPK